MQHNEVGFENLSNALVYSRHLQQAIQSEFMPSWKPMAESPNCNCFPLKIGLIHGRGTKFLAPYIQNVTSCNH